MTELDDRDLSLVTGGASVIAHDVWGKNGTGAPAATGARDGRPVVGGGGSFGGGGASGGGGTGGGSGGGGGW